MIKMRKTLRGGAKTVAKILKQANTCINSIHQHLSCVFSYRNSTDVNQDT